MAAKVKPEDPFEAERKRQYQIWLRDLEKEIEEAPSTFLALYGRRVLKMRQQTENEIQMAFFQWLAFHEKKHPELSLFYAIPNGTNKSYTARMVHQATGLKSGVPDVHLPIANGFYNGLYIEFKAKRGVVSDKQQEWHERLRNVGHRVEIIRSWTDAANLVIDYLKLPVKKI